MTVRQLERNSTSAFILGSAQRSTNMTQNITIPTVTVTFKSLGCQIGTCKATKKLIEDDVTREIGPAIRRWDREQAYAALAVG